MSKKFENGTGTIRQRKNGVWEGQYWFQGKRKSIYGRTPEEVRIRLNTTLAEVMSGDHCTASSMTLSEWMTTWLKDYAKPTVRHSTYLSYSGYCNNHVIPVLGRKRLKDLTIEQLQQFFNMKSEKGRLDGAEGGLSPKTLKNMRNMLNLVFKQAIVNKLILSNPIVGVKISRVEPKEMRVLSLWEQDALESVVSSSINPIAYGIIIALNTGLRIGELLGLQWQDVDIDRSMSLCVRRILVRQKKSDRLSGDYEILTEADKTALMLGKVKTYKGYRKIPLTDEAIDMFHALKVYQHNLASAFGGGFNPKGFVFCNEQGMVIEPRTYMDIFYGFVKAAGIQHANFHCTRHTFATRAIEMGMDLNTLADVLGHAQPSTTLNMYGHSMDDQKRREMSKFNKKPAGHTFAAVNFGGTGSNLRVVQNDTRRSIT